MKPSTSLQQTGSLAGDGCPLVVLGRRGFRLSRQIERFENCVRSSAVFSESRADAAHVRCPPCSAARRLRLTETNTPNH
jgi:hypothetical protein